MKSFNTVIQKLEDAQASLRLDAIKLDQSVLDQLSVMGDVAQDLLKRQNVGQSSEVGLRSWLKAHLDLLEHELEKKVGALGELTADCDAIEELLTSKRSVLSLQYLAELPLAGMTLQ